MSWTPGPWEPFDANEGTDYLPMWQVANDAFHNPLADDEQPWIAVEIHVGRKADAELIALAPEMAEAIMDADMDRLEELAEKLRAIQDGEA